MVYIFRRKKLHNGRRIETGPYWIGYCKDGRRHKETTGTENLAEAEKIRDAVIGHQMSVADMLTEYATLKPRLKAFEYLFPQAASTLRQQPTVGDLLDGLLKDYELNARKSVQIAQWVIEKHLRPAFGGILAAELTTEQIQQYVSRRKGEGLASISINNQLTLLRRAFMLARIAKVIVDVPHIPMLQGARKSREGFFTEEEFQRFAKHAPAYLVTICETARFTGFRRGELLKLEWRHVSLKEGWIRLEAGTTKNGDARTSPILPRLLPVLAAQWELTQKLQQQNGVIIPYVFHQDGQPIGSIRSDFENACKLAGLPKTFHDLRRTFRRYLAQAGVDEKVGMELMGHKDRRTYYSYQPVIGEDKVEAAEKLQKVVTKW